MNLSRSERIVLEGYAAGLMANEIAARQGWNPNLPHVFVHRAKRKLRCRTRIQTVVKYMLMIKGAVNAPLTDPLKGA